MELMAAAGLLEQPLAAVAGPGTPRRSGTARCAPRPEDRMLSVAEWAQVAARIMHRAGLAPEGDGLGVRWVAVRHAADHIHLVATLARQDGTRPRDLERLLPGPGSLPRRLPNLAAVHRPGGSHGHPPPDPGGDGTGGPARLGGTGRVTLRREVCTAAAGAGSQREFFARLGQAGVLVRERHSTVYPDQVTRAAEQAADEAGLFARLRATGVLVRVRFREDRSGTGHWVFCYPPRPLRARRNTPVVRGWPTGRRPAGDEVAAQDANQSCAGQGVRAAATCAVSSELRTKNAFPSRNFQ